MALTMKQWSFSKRKNSTLTPTGAGSDASIVLKHGANIISPVFTMASASEPAFNYCQFNGRYYFVKSKTNLRNGMWDIECIEDYLGTWKTDIGSTSTVILYATGGRNDIIDNRIPLKDTINVSKSGSVNLPFATGPSEMYVAGITGNGSLGMYAFYNASHIAGMLDGVDTWGGGLANLDDVLKQLIYGGGASENLKSVISLPILLGIADIGGVAENIYLGNYPAGDGNSHIVGQRITTPIHSWSATSVSLSWEYSDWRRNGANTEVYCHVPFMGLVRLPFNSVRESDSISVKYSICATTGDLSAYIMNESGVVIATASSNVAGFQAFGNSGYNAGGVIASAIAGIGAVGAGLLAGNVLGVGAGLATLAGGIAGNMAGDASGSPVISGTTLAGQDRTLWTVTINRQTANDPSHYNALMGKPVNGVATIGTYSGYVQTDGASVSGAMLDDEREAINQMLDRGIYYE